MSLNYYVLKFGNISKTFKAFTIPKSNQHLLQIEYPSFPDVKILNYYAYTDNIDIFPDKRCAVFCVSCY